MIKKVRKPGQERVRTSAHSIRSNKPSGITRQRPLAEKIEEKVQPEEELISIDNIILE